MTAPPDFEAMARGLFSFAGDKRVATITIDPSIYAVAEALSKAYFGGVADERTRAKAACKSIRQQLMREQMTEEDRDEAGDLVARAFGALLCERAVESPGSDPLRDLDAGDLVAEQEGKQR